MEKHIGAYKAAEDADSVVRNQAQFCGLILLGECSLDLDFTFAETVVTLVAVSKKSGRIAALIDGCSGRGLAPHYLGYFECFNRGLFYESHDVLEELWLKDRNGANAAFYKGLIQFAGAFVHLQKHTSARPRLRPAAALLKLSRANLSRYSGVHEQLDVPRVLALIEEWLGHLEKGEFAVNPLAQRQAPQLKIEGDVRRYT